MEEAFVCVTTAFPSVKLNNPGDICVIQGKFSRGPLTVKDPVMLHAGDGQGSLPKILNRAPT
jgi:hypothetical protein